MDSFPKKRENKINYLVGDVTAAVAEFKRKNRQNFACGEMNEDWMALLIAKQTVDICLNFKAYRPSPSSYDLSTAFWRKLR